MQVQAAVWASDMYVSVPEEVKRAAVQVPAQEQVQELPRVHELPVLWNLLNHLRRGIRELPVSVQEQERAQVWSRSFCLLL